MLYIFAFPGYVKMGYTRVGPYRRAEMGFWHNVHPSALCYRLDEWTLLHLFEGDEAIEKALHAALVPDCGEFYKDSRLAEVLGLMSLTLEALPLPAVQLFERRVSARRPCCGGDHSGFQRDDHRRRSAATVGRKAPCDRCGKRVSVRRDKLKAHQKSCQRP